MSGLDWFPTFMAAAGYKGDIAADLREGKMLSGKEYKVHLDGYDQMDMLTKGAKSARNEVWYFTESTLAAARIGDYKYVFIDQPQGWFGPKVKLDWPGIYNLRLDPFEKMNLGESLFAADWWAFEFWRFVFVQQEVALGRLGSPLAFVASIISTKRGSSDVDGDRSNKAKSNAPGGGSSRIVSLGVFADARDWRPPRHGRSEPSKHLHDALALCGGPGDKSLLLRIRHPAGSSLGGPEKG
jgi:hypothetical protein